MTNDAQQMTHDALQQKCFTWHWNNRPHERGRLWMNYNNPKNRIHGAILRAMGLLRGVYDLSFMHPDGHMLFIEIKTGAGRLSKHQKQFREMAIATGHQCVTVRSFNEFKALFHVERTPRTERTERTERTPRTRFKPRTHHG